jgi:hypothetical protein
MRCSADLTAFDACSGEFRWTYHINEVNGGTYSATRSVVGE